MATSKSQNPFSSSASSSKPELKGRYDIFLSFRGSDTRKKFTDHLNHALVCEGFQTFRDDDEIERGEVIESESLEAIRNSRMSVIVLSENYANSTSCLFELQMILELCKKSDHFLLPVFYEVEPEVLKGQSENLVFENKEATVERVKGWSQALKEVARMTGKVFRKESDGYEATFIEEIVGQLKSKVVGKHLMVGDHLVGMDWQTIRVTSWLKDMSTRVGILLICGMGGIGKTTIAKVIFNSNHTRYDAACFLPNIREVAKAPNGLVRLQRQLLSNILGKEEHKVNDVDDGCRRMKCVLANKRILLVLDDVDQTDQLSALAGQQDWFKPGSKIIIITRIERMMNDDEIYEVYRPQKLGCDESLELFSWHAFGQKHPAQGHMDLSKRFVQHCDGLPLALQVVGSSVRKKNIDLWESELQKLEAASDNAIPEKLEISYDSLKDKHDKDLFLDIACFFVGKKKNKTIKILEGCDCFPLAGIHNLVDRNLLTIENETLQMHQLLQDMGKQIVCRESKHPEKRSRIWRPRETFNILLEKSGTEKIEGLVLDMNVLGNSDMAAIEANTFEKMHNLRLLKLSGVQLSGTSKAFPKRLRWLYWRGFPSAFFPNDFPLENLVSLDMRYSNLKQLWEGTQVLGSLKILNLSHSPKLVKTPDFSRIPNLEKLVLKVCPSLFEVDESIVELRMIESLNLQDCKKLRKLPKNIGMLESLVEIDISGCSNLMGAIEELGKMKSLQVLKASGMEVVSQASIWPWVPKPRVQMSLASLPWSLVRLNLSDCNLTDDAFSGDLKLSKLKHLFLGGNPVSSLPNFIKDLTGLQTLDLSRCPKLQQIRWSTTILHKLVVERCDALKKVTFEGGTYIDLVVDNHSYNLSHIQDRYKFLPIREVDVELLNSIGFFNLDSMAEVDLTFRQLRGRTVKGPIQILYEDNVFNTVFPGREVPHWFSNKNGGSTISFTATLSPHFGFRGLNLCVVYTLLEEREPEYSLPLGDEGYGINYKGYGINYQPLQFEIHNKSSGMKTVYASSFVGIPGEAGDVVWLIHCFVANLLTEGDEVEVSFMIIDRQRQIKECGVHVLYFEAQGEVSQYVSSIQHSWDRSYSLYIPEEGMYRRRTLLQFPDNWAQ
ncbi:disease resistance protein RPV1-like isoform X3 [Rhododendron vialii]|uniref:disease resistance protein RPV1-like isoform X3 n=1 Tax=Rhododendron vialii TaxID=182163 RepID=UPI00265DA740|nr:disease resistance protein RPV1-like isoform X3 [Rhododendron vialii]